MKKALSVLLIMLMSMAYVFSQDSTEIYFEPENLGDYTQFKFSFENKNQSSVKRVKLEIETDGITFSDASITGEASNRGWFPLIDTSNHTDLYYFGDETFIYEETAGLFHFDLDGDDAVVSIKWTTIDSLGTELKSGVSKLIYSVDHNSCWSIARTATAKETIKISGNDFTNGNGFTWETWFHLNVPMGVQNVSGYHKMIICTDNDDIPDGNGEVYLGFGHSTINMRSLVFSVGGDLPNTVSYDMNGMSGWFHVAGVWDPNTMRISLYVNGILEDSKILTHSNLPFLPDGIEIGQWYGSNDDYYFQGLLDEIRFWSVARSHYDIVANMYECDLSSPDLEGYYPIEASDQWAPIDPAEWGCHLIDHTSNGLNSDLHCDIDWSPQNAPLFCCGGLESLCLCADEYGNPNYEISSVINLNDPDDCCWRIELDVKCDMLFINRLWFNFPAVSPLTPISAPSGWNVIIPGMGGYLIDFPNGYLPQGVHTFDMCFSSPSNPTQFPVEIHLLDYYDDSNYDEPCDPVVAEMECDSLCECDAVYLTTIDKIEISDSTCCHEVTVRADCDKQEIVFLEFEFENSLITSWPTGTGWTSVSAGANADKYEADAGNIMTGNHKFMFCFPFDMHQTTIILHYHGASDNDVCPPDTFDLVCGCCDKSFINTTYWLGYNPPSNWKADENYCTKRQHTWVKLQAGPLPTTRVAMHIVRAIRIYKILNPLDASETTHIEPLQAYIDAIRTPTSWCPTCNSGNGNPWVGFMGSGNVAPLGFLPYSPPYLPLDFVSCFPAHPNNSHQSRSEIIWGGFNTLPAVDISSPVALTGITGQTPPNYGNLISYRIGFKKTCECIDQGDILEDTIRYWVRYYVTDETCCTCDTLIEREIIIPQPPNNAVTPPFASISMNNLTSGALSLQSNLYYSNDLKINSISLEPLEGVQIISMKDPISGEEAEIKDNIAYMQLSDKILDSIIIFIDYANPNQDFMFKNRVSVELQSGVSEEEKVVWPEKFIVTAKVPSDDTPDLLEEGNLPEGKTMRTIALHLTNKNVYEEPISRIMIQATNEDCKVAAVGRPVDFGEGRVLVDFSELEDELYVQGKDHDDLMDSIYLDSLYAPDAEKPGHRKIVPGETVQPLYITVTTPNDFEGPLVLNYNTYNEDGIGLSSGEVTTLITGITKEIDPPSELMLNCFPNPANTEVTFSIDAARSFEEVSITITDLQGNTIGSVITGKHLETGRHLIPYNISALPSGSYYYTIKSGSISKTKLMNIVR